MNLTPIHAHDSQNPLKIKNTPFDKNVATGTHLMSSIQLNVSHIIYPFYLLGKHILSLHPHKIKLPETM